MEPRETFYYNRPIHGFSKQPDEVIDITVDFSEYMATGETINSTPSTVTAANEAGTAYADLIGTPVWGNQSVTFPVKAGVSGTVYIIKVAMTTTTTAKVMEVDIRCKVLEIGT